MDLLRGPLSGNAGVAEAGLAALANLATNDDNRILLIALGACEGECFWPSMMTITTYTS